MFDEFDIRKILSFGPSFIKDVRLHEGTLELKISISRILPLLKVSLEFVGFDGGRVIFRTKGKFVPLVLKVLGKVKSMGEVFRIGKEGRLDVNLDLLVRSKLPFVKVSNVGLGDGYIRFDFSLVGKNGVKA